VFKIDHQYPNSKKAVHSWEKFMLGMKMYGFGSFSKYIYKYVSVHHVKEINGMISESFLV
jgi:hypothetical protein